MCGIIFFFLTEQAVLDLTSPLYDAKANQLSTRRRRLLAADTQTVLTNQQFVLGTGPASGTFD